MFEWLTKPSISLSLITLISLLVNAVTIYRWVSEHRKRAKVNDQAFQMVRGLALANTRRSNVIVTRIRSLESQGKQDEEAMIFLENMYSDAKSNIESLLAAAKALKPEEANKLPYDGDSLLNQSMIESYTLQIKQHELQDKLSALQKDSKTNS